MDGPTPVPPDDPRLSHLERQLTLQQMRIFKAAVEHRNFTRAADALRLSQPAVTQQVHSMEKTFGRALFFSGRGAAEVTAEGTAVYQSICRILANVRELDQAAADVGRATQGTVHVAGDSTFGTYVLPRAVARFQEASPTVHIELAVARGSSIRDRLLRRDSDVGVSRHVWEDERLVSAPLIEDELRCFAAPSHPLSRRSRVRLEDLSRRVMLVRAARSESSAPVERLFRDRGLNLDPAMEVDDNEVRKRAAIEGLGAAVLSAYAVRAELDAGLLVDLAAEGFPLRLTWHSVCLRHLSLAPAAEAFRQYLHSGTWLPPAMAAARPTS
ncbi:MAG: LysR family transcriptional regulator [Candidatus Dormibacteria bacterium]